MSFQFVGTFLMHKWMILLDYDQPLDLPARIAPRDLRPPYPRQVSSPTLTAHQYSG